MVSAEIGAKRIIRLRTRSAIPRRNATERVSTVATAAPAMPSFGACASPRMSTGSSTSAAITDASKRRNGVRVFPEARNAASTAKKPKYGGAPMR